MKKITILVIALGLLLSACGGKATPTQSAVDVSNTALAEARTMVASTQAAMPTSTPIPTNTEVPTIAPTETPFPIPTLSIPTSGVPAVGTPVLQPTTASFPTATVVVSGSGGCYAMTEWEGGSAQVTMINQTKGVVTLSLNGVLPNGDCGAFSRVFEKSNSATIPLACYFVYAWVDGKQDFTLSGNFCFNDQRNYTITITNDAIKVK